MGVSQNTRNGLLVARLLGQGDKATDGGLEGVALLFESGAFDAEPDDDWLVVCNGVTDGCCQSLGSVMTSCVIQPDHAVQERELGALPEQTLTVVGAVIFLGIGCSGLGYLFWYAALERIETSKVAAFLYLEPLVTLAAAVTLLGEPIAVSTLMGGGLVLLGVFNVQQA